MATSLQHYQVAERTLDEIVSGVYPTAEQISFALAKAQVHATLALAAATALGIGYSDEDSVTLIDWNQWHNAAGISVAPPARAEEARRFWAIWTADHSGLRAQVSGADLTTPAEALERAAGGEDWFDDWCATSVVQEIDAETFSRLLDLGPGADAPSLLRPKPRVSEASPTDPAALGAWLRMLPHSTILYDRAGFAWQRMWGGNFDREDDSRDQWPALFSVGLEDGRSIENDETGAPGEGLRVLADRAPFTVLALGPDDAEDGAR